MICHLLLTMTETYKTVIIVLETSLATFTLDLVKSKLLDVELKKKMPNKIWHQEMRNVHL